MNPVIRSMELSKKFGRRTVLDRVDLEVPEGGVYGLVGPNGAGKTTAIKTLLNIHRATSGRGDVLGVDSRRLSPREFAQIGYVAEDQQMPDWMTVGYFLDYLKPFYPDWDQGLAAELVNRFDLPRDRKLRHLSRGMRMKAALASSLAYRPKLLILDEPFAGVDALVRDELIDGVLDRAGETTIFISSHDLAEIESFASHIGYLDRGRLEFSEEMTALAARFREIEVVVDAPLPANLPRTWANVESSAAVVRFVETHFEGGRTEAEIRAVFPALREVTIHPMPLRQIFVTLAKASRKAA